MTAAPDIPYTDRNVREDAILTEYALEYLEKYGGSFEPLVNAQNMLRAEGELPTAIIRVVLNCMRFDTNVASLLPPPKPYLRSVPNKNAKKKSNPFIAYSDEDLPTHCGNTESHSWHTFKHGDLYPQCKGVPFPINRNYFTRPATVKKPYMRSRTGSLFHHVNTEPGTAYVSWYPPNHSYGFGDRLPVLYARTLCKYPGVIQQPTFLDVLPPLEVQEMMIVKECPHCADVISDRDASGGVF